MKQKTNKPQESWEEHICPTCGEKHIDIECPEYEFSGVSKTLYDFSYDVDSDHGTISLDDGIKKYSKKLSSQHTQLLEQVREMIEEYKCPLEANSTDDVNGILNDLLSELSKLEGDVWNINSAIN